MNAKLGANSALTSRNRRLHGTPTAVHGAMQNAPNSAKERAAR